MSNGLIAFLVALGIGAWIYNYIMPRTGNQAKNALIIAGTAAVIIFVAVLSLISLIPRT